MDWSRRPSIVERPELCIPDWSWPPDGPSQTSIPRMPALFQFPSSRTRHDRVHLESDPLQAFVRFEWRPLAVLLSQAQLPSETIPVPYDVCEPSILFSFKCSLKYSGRRASSAAVAISAPCLHTEGEEARDPAAWSCTRFTRLRRT